MKLPIKVAFLGPESTYTHQAVIQQFGNDPKSVEIFPQASIQACFDQLDQKNTDFAVVPLENSTNGSVVFTYDLLRDWFISTTDLKAPTFTVVAEQFVEIHHFLFSNASNLSKVDKLYSHPQVWGQVTEFLDRTKFGARLTKIDTSSTAQAAEKVFEDSTGTSACICSEMSGKLYNLPPKAAEIEDLKGNTTRFLVLGYGSMLGSEANKISSDDDVTMEHVTSFVFVLNRNDPGALCEALHVFKTNKVNLTSIASRPSKKTPWEYVFFVDSEGFLERNALQKLISDLKEHCRKVAMLGSFVRSWRYRKQ